MNASVPENEFSPSDGASNLIETSDIEASASSEQSVDAPLINAPLINAMTIDVEEYFQVGAFESFIDRGTWNTQESRVVRAMDCFFDLMDEANVKATLFFLGCIAEQHPAIVRRAVADGHEIASHGFDHKRATTLTPDEFREDVVRTRKLLEDIGGRPVIGYRAPNFSIGPDNMWAFDVLGEAGYRYSSSIYPVKHDHYGMPDAPRFAHRAGERADGILEVPMTTVPLAGRNLPGAGGGYFRLLPYAYSRWAMARVNARDGEPGVFYCHPWEFDPDQPRQHQASARSKFRHYVNLSRMEGKVRRLLADFSWGRMDEIFLGRMS